MQTIPERTSWIRIFSILAVGISAAFLIGKVPAALPVMRTEMSLTLFQAGLIVSMFTIVTAGLGIFLGAFTDRIGHFRIGVGGLAVMALAGIAGAFAPTPEILILTRTAEGIGFVFISVSMPPLLVRLASLGDRAKALGFWGTYVPAGSASILIAGGLLIEAIGWRGLWLAVSAFYIFMFILLWWATRPLTNARAQPSSSGDTERISAVLKAPGPRLLAAVFMCYSALFLGVTSFVPLILVEQASWSIPSAAAAGALVVSANIIGNVCSGFLLDRGLSRARLQQLTAIGMALGAGIMFVEALPISTRIAGAFFFSAIGGTIPGSLFSGVPLHAPSPAHASTVNGLMFQGVSIGQFAGPALTTWMVGIAGNWTAALYFVLPAATLCFLFATQLGRVEGRMKAAN